MEPLRTLIFLFALTLSLSQIECTGNVEQVCEQTTNKENCIQAFGTNPDSKNANLRQLGIIALKIAAKKATDTSLYIEKSLNGTKLEPEYEQVLSDCLEEYVDANEQLDNSVAALLSKADADIKTWINAALAGIKTCDDSFTDKSSKNAPLLKKRNADFRQLCNNVLVVSKLLAEKKNNKN